MNRLLIIAGSLSVVAALMHIGCIYFGAEWYRFFGAGEQMALMAEQGSLRPTIITSVIVVVLSIWSAYAYSAAKLIPQLPLIRIALIVITSIYLLRGIAGFFFINNPIDRSPEFWFWSSAVCLIFGLFHLFGLKQQWPQLSGLKEAR